MGSKAVKGGVTHRKEVTRAGRRPVASGRRICVSEKDKRGNIKAILLLKNVTQENNKPVTFKQRLEGVAGRGGRGRVPGPEAGEIAHLRLGAEGGGKKNAG